MTTYLLKVTVGFFFVRRHHPFEAVIVAFDIYEGVSLELLELVSSLWAT